MFQGRELLSLSGQKLYSIPFDEVLSSNIALEFFMDFLANVGAKHYIYFYFTVEVRLLSINPDSLWFY